MLKEYTQIKCKQLLEIAAEKAKVEWVDYTNGEVIVDKDSILNCVDLDSFIS